VGIDSDGKGDRVAALERALAEKDREIADLRTELLCYRTIVEHAPVGVFENSSDGECTYVNDAWCNITGMKAEDALGFGFMQIFHPEDRAYLAQRFPPEETAPRVIAVDYRVIRPSGEVRWIHGQSMPLVDTDGKTVGNVGTITDITEHKAAQAELEEVKAELERGIETRTAALRKANDELRIFGALIDHAADAIMLASPEGDVLHVNPAYRWLIGGEANAIGASLVDAMQPVDEAAREALYSALVDGSAYRGAVTLRGASGKPLPAQVDCYVVRAGPEEVLGLATVIRDLTAEKQAEEERAALEAKVIASQDALIRELSTPLVPIAKGVLAMPLVGSISEGRAQQILDSLLSGIQALGATTAVLDITGVSMVDTHAANALVSAARAARLLGTEVIISGIGPAVARTLIELGVDLGGITTKSTLAAAISQALGQGKARRG
jgi:rsbT co-antagonist protein RsbR